MNIKWNEYTWYSKWAALIFFIIILPIWTFYVGLQYQQTKDALILQSSMISPVSPSSLVNTNPPVSTEGAKGERYVYTKFKFVFDHPADVVFRPAESTFSPLSESVEADLPSTYNIPNSFQRLQKIYVGIKSATTKEVCINPSNTTSTSKASSTQITLGESTFYKSPIESDCAMDGCATGSTYTTWHNNICYGLTTFSIQANPEKTFDSSNPNDQERIDEAKKAGALASQKIRLLAEKILATFQFDN